MKHPKLRFVIIAALTQLTTFLPGLSHAAPGTLANSPLFLSATVPPNIYFLLDDSGSMEWDLLTSEGSSGLPDIGGWTGNYYILPTRNSGYDLGYLTAWSACTSSGRIGCYPYTIPDEASVSGAWRAKNSSFNTLYYNPETTYTPWVGLNSVGTPFFSDATPTAAPVDPNNPTGFTLDLTQTHSFYNYAPSLGGWYIESTYPAQHYTWTDDDGDGVVEDSDTHSQVLITSSTSTYTKATTRTDCAGASCTYAEEIQNFANWFTYYRKRSYVAKKAIGAVANENSSSYLGLQLYNDSISTTKSDLSDPTDKANYLDDLYDLFIHCDWTNGCPGTPARTALEDLGDLFEGGSTPILSSADGGACQQNFSVVMTDGYWNGWDPSVGNADADDPTNDFDGGHYADTISNTLADVAMHYYKRDLKPLIGNDVPTTPTVDEADHQHLVTYTVAFGVTGTLDPFDTKTPGDASDTDPTDDSFSWTDVWGGDAQKIDDMWHAAYNGRGLFLSAQNPDELETSLNDAISDIAARTGSAAAVAFNSTSLEAGSAAYLARFNSGDWSGELLSYSIDPLDGDLAATPSWNAGDQLDSQSPSTRVILTYDGSAGVPFQWSDITTAQKNDLKTNPSGGTDSDTIGEARLDFLRGDRSNEGTGHGFRSRAGVLGDLVHSNPVYVGAPQMGWPDTAPFPTTSGQTYSDYETAKDSRDGVVYVGSNDGMLHGFDVDTGDEVLAYIPSNLFSTNTSEGLHYLTNPAYNHRYYTDASPSVSDVFVKTSPTSAAAWSTVLVGGEWAGGRGLFALDVTNPTNFSEVGGAPDDIVMWEFSDADDNDLGYTLSKPTIALTNAVDGSGNNRWAAIIGNGYNSDNGVAKLFILFLEGGIDGSWTTTGDYASTDYIELTTGVGTAGSKNGLSTPGLVDLDGNGTIDRVYAGDLEGNLWAFDLCNEDSHGECRDSGWESAYKQGSNPKPLFIAEDSSGNAQPITSKPVAVKHPTEADASSGSNAPNTLVFFGTGQYLVESDKTTTDTQSFYGIWDEGSKELERGDLLEQTFMPDFPSDSRVPTTNEVAYSASGASKEYGWFLDFPTAGERLYVNPKVRGGYVTFNTNVPETTACSYGGYAWLWAINQHNGGHPEDPVLDYNRDGQVTASDNVSDGSQEKAPGAIRIDGGLATESNYLGTYQYTVTSDGTVNKLVVDIDESPRTGRLSWQELYPD